MEDFLMKSKRYFLPNKIDLNPALQSQIDYATSLSITVPNDATKSDVKALIDLYLDNDMAAPVSLLQFTKEHNILCSSYAGNKYAYNLLFDNLELLDQIAFFCFCVYHYLVEDDDYNLAHHKHKDLFYDFANHYINNVYFIESMKDYYGEELIIFGKNTVIHPDGSSDNTYGGSKYTLAYKTASSYIETKFNIVVSKTLTEDLSTSKKRPFFLKLLTNIMGH